MIRLICDGESLGLNGGLDMIWDSVLKQYIKRVSGKLRRDGGLTVSFAI